MTEQTKEGFKNSSVLTRWTIGLLAAEIVIGVIAVVSGFWEYKLLQDIYTENYESEQQITAALQASDLRQGIIGISQCVLGIVALIFFFKWIYRANYNARQLGAERMKFTPGWSIGWFFIPIFNLWKPYQAMKEIWKASKDPANWPSQSVTAFLPIWWILGIVSSNLSRASFKTTMHANELEDFINANLVTLVSDSIDIPLALITIFLFSKIYLMQTQARQMQICVPSLETKGHNEC